MKQRKAQVERKTLETQVRIDLCLDGTGQLRVETGIGFLDHLVSGLARHASWDLELTCTGDLQVDDHHTAEDCALSLGQAIDEALAERRGIVRFGSALAPLDEALARAVVDLSGRPFAAVQLELNRDSIGGLACENAEHFVRSLAMSAKICIHLDVLRGDNDHHRAEAAYKALALALRQALAPDGSDRVPSTKGRLG
jgi:imidazoleglycerol phosphate dehydratase HisB